MNMMISVSSAVNRLDLELELNYLFRPGTSFLLKANIIRAWHWTRLFGRMYTCNLIFPVTVYKLHRADSLVYTDPKCPEHVHAVCEFRILGFTSRPCS